MSEIGCVYNQNSRQLFRLASTLKNNVGLQDKIYESLTLKDKRNDREIKKDANKKFQKHPRRLSSESDTSQEDGLKDELKLNLHESCDSSETGSDSSCLTRRLKTDNMDVHNEINTKHQSVEDKITQINTKAKAQNGDKCAKCHNSAGKKDDADLKVRNMLKKVLSTIEDIGIIIELKFDHPDGDADMEKRRLHGIGFSTRFSANYLYQLERQMDDIHRITSTGKVSSSNMKNVHQLFVNNLNTILQAVQFYLCHMTKTLPNMGIDKLKIVLEHLCTLCDIHNKFLTQSSSANRTSLIDSVMKTARDMVGKTREIIWSAALAETATCPASKLELLGYKVEKRAPKARTTRKKNGLKSSSLSMYSISSGVKSKDAFWKKTVEALARDKLKYNHVQSRYKTSNFKHRPPKEKPTVIELPTKSKLFDRRSSCVLKNTPLVTPINEDEIETMVRLHGGKENSSGMSNVGKTGTPEYETNLEQIKNDHQLRNLTSYIQDFHQQVCGSDGKAMSQRQLEIVLKSILGMALDGGKVNNEKETGTKNGTLFVAPPPTTPKSVTGTRKDEQENTNGQQISKEQEAIAKNLRTLAPFLDKMEIGETDGSIEKEPETRKIARQTVTKGKSKRRQTVTVTGAKNAQLICITDEGSAVDQLENEPNNNNNDAIAKNAKNNKSVINKEIQKNKEGDVNANKQAKESHLKISRVPKNNLRPLVWMPRTSAKNIIQCKINFQQQCEHHSLYQKKSKIPPWVIVDKISDELLDKLLLEVVKESQANELLEGLYQSEFQQ